MACVTANNQVVSFAEFTDVLLRDQRLFEVNEGLSDDVVEPLLERATERILTRLRASNWWQTYWLRRQTGPAITNIADIPSLDSNRIQARITDFTDLCVFTALAEYILPLVADFGNDASAERKKMGYYSVRANELFDELIRSGDWYNFDNDATIESSEKQIGYPSRKRVR